MATRSSRGKRTALVAGLALLVVALVVLVYRRELWESYLNHRWQQISVVVLDNCHPFAVACDPATGVAWVVSGRSLLRIDPGGRRLEPVTLSATSVAIGAQTGHIWAATQTEVFRLDSGAALWPGTLSLVHRPSPGSRRANHREVTNADSFQVHHDESTMSQRCPAGSSCDTNGSYCWESRAG